MLHGHVKRRYGRYTVSRWLEMRDEEGVVVVPTKQPSPPPQLNVGFAQPLCKSLPHAISSSNHRGKQRLR